MAQQYAYQASPVLDTYIFLHVLSIEAHYKECVLCRRETVSYFYTWCSRRLHGTQQELSSASPDDKQARSYPPDKCYATKCLIRDRSGERAGSVLCLLCIKDLYLLILQQEQPQQPLKTFLFVPLQLSIFWQSICINPMSPYTPSFLYNFQYLLNLFSS